VEQYLPETTGQRAKNAMSEWFVRGRALEEQVRTGGINAEKGFTFQRAYAAWLLSGLLTSEDGVVAIRYEGAQDVDLMKADGSQIYVQVKFYEKTDLDWATMRTIVQRFADDLRVAQPTNDLTPGDKLSFRLVAAATTSDTEVLQLLRQVNGRVLGPKIAKELSGSQINAELKARIKLVLAGLTAEVLPAGIPSRVFRLMAEARLSRFGVLPDNIDEAIRVILDRVTSRRTTIGADVLEWISSYLPKEHPASEQGAIRSFATRVAKSSKLGTLFYAGQSDVWTGISQNLDVPREVAASLRDKLLTSHAAKLVIHGPSGAGKSTLARRVLWDLQCSGKIFALELQNLDCSDQDWEQARRLAKRLRTDSGSPTVLLIDDVHDSESVIQRIRELEGDADLRIVTTTWKSSIASLNLGAGVLNVPLTSISKEEATAVAQRLGKDLSGISGGDLTNLLAAGQFIVLNIAILEDGALDRFGGKLLERVKQEAGEAVQLYLDLCACSAGDRPIPLALLNRRPHANELGKLLAPAANGLVFLVGTDRIRSGHRLLAEAVLLAAQEPRTARLIELATLAELSNDFERRFAIGLLEDCIESDPFISAHQARLVQLLQCFAPFGDYVDVLRCARILKRLNHEQAAKQMTDLATFDRVRTGPDAAAYRSEMEAFDPEGTFDHLLEFYQKHPTTWGWRNFLRLAKRLDPDRQLGALNTVQKYINQGGLTEGDAKSIIDLLSVEQRSHDAIGTTKTLLGMVPSSVVVARAVAHLIKVRLRSTELFSSLLSYSLPLLGITPERRRLARNLASAASYVDLTARRQLLDALKGLFPIADERARASILHSCAALAEKADVDPLLTLAGPTEGSTLMNAAKQVLRKKAAATVQ